MKEIFYVLCIICFICMIISIYRFRLFKKEEAIKKKLEKLSEVSLWKEWKNSYYNVNDKKNDKSLIFYHNLVINELDRRDLFDLEPIKESEFKDLLSEMYLDVFVYKEFTKHWNALNKGCKHPRTEAVYFALAREELISRYKKKYAFLSDEVLKKNYTLLIIKNQEDRISRSEYEELNVAKAEMNKRRFPT